jgi:ketosteroid isomerase-like protein
MHKVFAAFAVGLLARAPIATAQQSEPMAVVRQFVDAFNKGDVPAVLAACAEQTVIIDEFAPFVWHGAGSCGKWASDYDADAKTNGITEGSVTLGKALHVDIAGDHAYVVVPADYAFKLKGKPVKETAALLTVALRKEAAHWRITGWSWAKNQVR